MLGNIIDYRSLGGSSFIINNRATIANGQWASPYYYIQVTAVDGHFGADISYESHPIPNAIGEKSGDVFRRGKTLTITGMIWGRAFSELYSGADFLSNMLAERELRKLVFIPWNHGVNCYYNARPYQDLIITETVESGQYAFPFTFALRADDPRSRLLSNDSVFPMWQQ